MQCKVQRSRRSFVVFAFLLVAAMFTLPASADQEETVIGEGHIALGVFNAHPLLSQVLGVQDPEVAPYGFMLAVGDHQGATIETLVDDNSGAGYYVDMEFYEGDGAIESGRTLDAQCGVTEDNHGILQPPFGTHEIRTRCVVPDGAEWVYVHANTGVGLDVTVVV